MSEAAGQQHPIGIYLKIWILLFVLSTFSYLVDWYQFQGFARWTLILIFMFLKAGFIVAIFMHLTWERLSLKYVLLLPPPVSYTHQTLPTTSALCRSRWSPYH